MLERPWRRTWRGGGLNLGYAGVVPSRVAALATTACRILDMASSKKAKRVRRRRAAATLRASAVGNHPPERGSATRPIGLGVPRRVVATACPSGRRAMRHGRRQLLPGATGRVYLGRLDLRQGTGGSRLVLVYGTSGSRRPTSRGKGTTGRSRTRHSGWSTSFGVLLQQFSFWPFW